MQLKFKIMIMQCKLLELNELGTEWQQHLILQILTSSSLITHWKKSIWEFPWASITGTGKHLMYKNFTLE